MVKWKQTAAKKFAVRFWNFAKNENLRQADCSSPYGLEWRHR